MVGITLVEAKGLVQSVRAGVVDATGSRQIAGQERVRRRKRRDAWREPRPGLALMPHQALLLTNQPLRDGTGEETTAGREPHAIRIVVDQLLFGEPVQRGGPTVAESNAVSFVEYIQV